VHPMELHKTLMNSFLFNLALVLLCVLPVVQFSTNAFSMYARLTSADVLFGSTIRYLRFFRYFWQYNAFLFAILFFVLVSAIYFVS
jgi:LMBR1 domain-containing protein 1